MVEIMLSLENALNNSQEESLHPPGYSPEGHGRQVSDITPLPGEQCTIYFSVCPILVYMYCTVHVYVHVYYCFIFYGRTCIFF